jgi:hypothetical protein
MNRPRGAWIWATVAALAVCVGVVWLWPTPQPSGSSDDGTAPEPTGAVAPDLYVGPPTPGGHHDERQWTSRPWRPVARGFAVDFARPGQDLADWRRRVGRWVTDYLAAQYRHTARYRIPIARLTGLTGPDRPSQAVTATATYDTGLTLVLQLEVFPEQGWKVTRVTPVDPAGPA